MMDCNCNDVKNWNIEQWYKIAIHLKRYLFETAGNTYRTNCVGLKIQTFSLAWCILWCTHLEKYFSGSHILAVTRWWMVAILYASAMCLSNQLLSLTEKRAVKDNWLCIAESVLILPRELNSWRVARRSEFQNKSLMSNYANRCLMWGLSYLQAAFCWTLITFCSLHFAVKKVLFTGQRGEPYLSLSLKERNPLYYSSPWKRQASPFFAFADVTGVMGEGHYRLLHSGRWMFWDSWSVWPHSLPERKPREPDQYRSQDNRPGKKHMVV